MFESRAPIPLLILLAALAAAADRPAVIVNSGSTNFAGYRITVQPSGEAAYAPGPPRIRIPGRAEPQPKETRIPEALAKRLFSDLAAAAPLSSLPAIHCPKSASFGSTLSIELGSDRTPDLSCGDGGNSKLKALIEDANTVVKAVLDPGVASIAPAPASSPPSGAPSEAQSEAASLHGLLEDSPGNCAVSYQIARTCASAGAWPRAMDWLEMIEGTGLDPSRDAVFRNVPASVAPRFSEILGSVRDATAPVSRSRLAFQVPDGDLVSESIAYDSRSKSFYLGSMRKGEILRCTPGGVCRPFAGGLGVVLGLKGGDIYLTDTPAAAVWRLKKNAVALERLPGRFVAANGIALSPDASLLYVATFLDGITVVDLKTGAAAALAHPEGGCLANIDGLYFYGRSLLAIQNGSVSPRVIRVRLAPDLRTARRLEVLERRNPLFDGVTTGVLSGRDFFYMANIQDEKQSGFDPISILRLRLL